jgi:hypothetical protein
LGKDKYRTSSAIKFIQNYFNKMGNIERSREHKEEALFVDEKFIKTIIEKYALKEQEHKQE